jgi:excisionase family DNA binding protein
VKLLTVRQFAQRKGVSPRRVQQWIAQGRVRATPFGNQFAIAESELLRLKPLKRGPKPKQ